MAIRQATWHKALANRKKGKLRTMAQNKERQVLTNIEPTFYELLVKLTVEQLDVSVSSYVRNLIVKDLKDRGLLDEETMQKVLIG